MIMLRRTTCTHSMSGSLTAWFPDRLTTQAGVSGVASSRAITASTPIRLPWATHMQCVLVLDRQWQLLVALYTLICCFVESLTRILSKAEGVPPLCTCPRTVVRVSKPSLSVTSWTERDPSVTMELCLCYVSHT